MKTSLLPLAFAAFYASAASAIEANSAMQDFLETSILPWAQEQVIVDAINAQNATTGNHDASMIDQLDQAWRAEVGTAATPTIDPVLFNPASEFLRSRVAGANGMITEVFVMDAKGLNVAASDATSDYWQGDEAKFIETYGKGVGAVHFSEIEFDESSQTYQAQISVTLTDPTTGAPIGAMTVGIDAEALM